MSVRGKRAAGIVLPALMLVSVILLLLIATLVSTGTSSLRTTTLSQQSDVATYAAEAGLVEAAEEYRRTGKLDTTTTGKVEASQATYSVTRYDNPTTDMMDIPGGPSIPPSTLYLLSTGTSPNGTTERVGALFRTGLGVFQAGVVSDTVTTDNASFDAYDSSVSKEPAGSSQTNRGLFASSRTDDSVTDPQFSLLDTTVGGAVYVAPRTLPSVQIQKSGKTRVSREGVLAEPVTIEPVEVPKLSSSGKTQGGTTTGGDFDPATYAPAPFRMKDLEIKWNAGKQRFVFKDDGGWFGSYSIVGEVGVEQLQAARDSSPPRLEFDDGEGRRVTFDFASDTITYKDPKGSSGTHTRTIPDLVNKALEQSDVSTKNPNTMGPGKYSSVTIDDTTTKLEAGTYVIGDLDIVGDGQLEVPVDAKVNLYVTGRLNAEGENALINSSRLPPSLKLFYTGEKPVNLAGGSLSYMTLVAPDADIKLEGADRDVQSAFFGALVGKSVKVFNAALHFDVATEGVGTGTDGSVLSLLNRHRL